MDQSTENRILELESSLQAMETKRNEAQQRYLDEMVVSGKRGARIDELETKLNEAPYRYGAKITELETKLREVQQDNDELEAIHDLRHKADMRGIAKWREGHPERELRQPDHADLVVFLAEKVAELETRAQQAEQALLFYADPETYFAIGFFPDRPCGEFMDDFSETAELGMKPGKRAREVLKAIVEGRVDTNSSTG